MPNSLENKIRKLFPYLEWKRVKFITDGWDHDILMLDNNFVVRIPKNREARKRMKIDFCLLKYLCKKIDISIPVPVVKDDKTKVAIYKMVGGKTMSVWRYKRLRIKAKNKFSKDIALFLSQLHSIPPEDIKKCKVTSQNLFKEDREVRKNIKVVYSHLTKKEQLILDDFIIRRKNIVKEIKPTLIHGDLTSDNVFVDSKGNLGIIDFSDSIISDPAKDFAALFSYGNEFVWNVIKYYNPPKESELFFRAQIYYQDEAIKLLKLAVDGSKFISKVDAINLFRERFKIKEV